MSAEYVHKGRHSLMECQHPGALQHEQKAVLCVQQGLGGPIPRAWAAEHDREELPAKMMGNLDDQL